MDIFNKSVFTNGSGILSRDSKVFSNVFAFKANPENIDLFQCLILKCFDKNWIYKNIIEVISFQKGLRIAVGVETR
jgi:hypothetical protein